MTIGEQSTSSEGRTDSDSRQSPRGSSGIRLVRTADVPLARGGTVVYAAMVGDKRVGYVGDIRAWRGWRFGGRRWFAVWREDGDTAARWHTDEDQATRAAAVAALAAARSAPSAPAVDPAELRAAVEQARHAPAEAPGVIGALINPAAPALTPIFWDPDGEKIVGWVDERLRSNRPAAAIAEQWRRALVLPEFGPTDERGVRSAEGPVGSAVVRVYYVADRAVWDAFWSATEL